MASQRQIFAASSQLLRYPPFCVLNGALKRVMGILLLDAAGYQSAQRDCK